MYRKTFYAPWPVALAFVAVWLILAFLLTGPPLRRAANEGEFATITHKQYGFSIVYPTKWRVRTYGDAGYRGDDESKLEVFYNEFGPFWIEVRQKDVYQPDLKDAARWGLKGFETVNLDPSTRFEVGPLTEETVNGQPALRRRFTSEQYIIEEVYLVRASNIIILRLTSEVGTFEDVQDEFNRIVASFRSIE